MPTQLQGPLTRASHLMCKTPKGNNIMTSLTQANLVAHKDNPFRDNLWPLVVHISLIFSTFW